MVSTYKIVIAEGNRPSMYANRLNHIKKSFLDGQFDCCAIDALDESRLGDSIEDADAIIVSPGMFLSEKSIKKLNKCKCIVCLGVGYDNVDLRLAGEKEIYVANVPDYGTEEVADVTMAFILNLARKISAFNLHFRDSNMNWNWRFGMPIYRLRNRVLGIVGLGRIGTAVALRAKSFGLKVYFFDPYKEDGYEKALEVYKTNDLKELLSLSDIVTIHTPLTVLTKGMINKQFLGFMKKEAFLVNTARGLLFEDLDIIEWALKDNIIQAIATDVLPQEPPDPEHSLMKSWRAGEDWIKDRLFISPHAAFYSEEASFDLCSKAMVLARDIILGNASIMKNIVNREFVVKV